MVTSGNIPRTAKVRLMRAGAPVWNGRIGSLKRFKDDVREVASGFECGIRLDGMNDLKVGDIIEAFDDRELSPHAARRAGHRVSRARQSSRTGRDRLADSVFGCPGGAPAGLYNPPPCSSASSASSSHLPASGSLKDKRVRGARR